MAAIDLIVLGIIKQSPISAYDIQKTVDYRNISKWVKISTPSIYKKVLQLEQKGFIESTIEKNGKMPEKTIYSITDSGKKEFEHLMENVSCEPINFYLDFNAVIVNLPNLSEKNRKICLDNIKENLLKTRQELEQNLKQKEKLSSISKEALAVLNQQYQLALAIENWIKHL